MEPKQIKLTSVTFIVDEGLLNQKRKIIILHSEEKLAILGKTKHSALGTILLSSTHTIALHKLQKKTGDVLWVVRWPQTESTMLVKQTTLCLRAQLHNQYSYTD